MKRELYSRAERLGQILEVLHRKGQPMTNKQIAEGLGLKKSVHIKGMLDELQSAGLIDVQVLTLVNRMQAYGYTVNYQNLQKTHPELAKHLSTLRALS